MTDDYRLYKGAWVYKHDPHKEQKLSRKEMKEILSKGGVMLRNTYDFDCAQETSFWYVIKDQFGGMEELSTRKRNQVRNSLKKLRFEKIDPTLIIEKGYEVYTSAADSYRIKTVIPTKQEFVDRIKNAEENEYWGAFDLETGQLVAFSMNYVSEESAEYRTLKAIPEYMKKSYAYYGLIYEMNKYYLEDRGMRYVNDGSRTITNHSNVQSFLIDTLRFRKAYCHIQMAYKPWLRLVVSVLFPFRKWITSQKISAVLNQEAMARGMI